MIAEDSVRFAHSGPSQRFLRGLRPLVSVGPLPLPVSAGGHASAITTILPLEYRFSYRGKRLVNAEFAAIDVTHNIRKMIAKGYCVCSEVAVG